MVEIPLTNRREVALVDDADAPLVNLYKWYLLAPRHGPHYAKAVQNGKYITMHRLLCPQWKLIDHRDTNGLNNQRENLREATHAQNMRNTNPYQGRRFKGVGWEARRGRWRAYIEEYGRQTFLGRFDTAEEAAVAYNTEALRRWGEFARLNVIGGGETLPLLVPLMPVKRGLVNFMPKLYRRSSRFPLAQPRWVIFRRAGHVAATALL